MRLLAIVLVIVTSMRISHAQQVYVSDWRTISSTREVRDADADADGSVWVATSGGVQRTWLREARSTKYDNVNGLSTLECTAIYCDKSSGSSYVGQRDGSLDVFNAASATWTKVSDIQRASQYPKRSILDFAQRGDTIGMATEFGIVLLHANKGLFVETIDRIGPFPEKSKVAALAFFDQALWAIVNGVVVNARLDVPTLRLPSAWSVLGSAVGLPDSTEPIIHLASNGTTLVVASARRVFTWKSNRFWLVQTALRDINSLSVRNDTSIVVSTNAEILIDGKPLTLQSPIPGPIDGHRVVTSDAFGTSIITFVKEVGMGWIANDQWQTSRDANSPLSNQFTDITIDTQGWIWAATHTDGGYGGQGINVFDGAMWRSLNTATEPLLTSNGCYRVSALADGSVWIGTWGRGALRCTHSDGALSVTAVNATNSSLRGIPADSNYILVSEVATDRYGRTIVMNEQSTDRVFAVSDQSNQWSFRQNCSNVRENLFRSMTVDNNGGVWCGSPDSRGLLGYNDRNTPDTDDDVCNRILISNSQLQDNVVTSLATDLNGAIWIGTAKGLAVISSPWNLSNTAIPYVRRVSVMSSTYINDVFIDALNYKWVATTNGVFVLDESGIEVLATITTATSPLLDNNVRSIAIDPATGLAYFGTLKGCSVARTSSMRPLPNFDLRCFPQPFRAGTDESLVVDGLATDSEVRIMTSGGILVSAIVARGRQVLWDGRDVHGNYVPPGIYIASISSASTSSSSVVKIAVTR
ncbi:MAG: hypothetical protein FJ211_04075 [Ignavibacteria bacterium]|nr:hypothetical protein [Ignavibacteria bacterium]